MADDASSVDRARRQGSWARALDKVRRAIKRRASSSRNVLQPPPRVIPSQEAEDVALRVTEPAPISTQQPDLRDNSHTSNATPFQPVPAEPPTELLAVYTGLDADTEDDLDEPLLPMMSSRTGISQDKARDLFAKYGLQYEARSKRPQQEPPHKIRRVERPVRLRVHWTCHSCRTQFGIEKTCVSCGHRRCRECARHPPKRVRELWDSTRQQMEDEQVQSQRDVVSVPEQSPVLDEPVVTDLDLVQYQNERSATPDRLSQQSQASPPQESELSSPKASPRTSAPPTVPGDLISQPLELDDGLDDDQEEVSLPTTIQQYSIYTRPRTSVQALLKPKAQIVRRTCHKCDTQILPPSRKDCQSCGHKRCDLCPRYPPKYSQSSKTPQKLPEEEVPTCKAVHRVYRKPRQRVRYTCEHCHTLFIEGDRCQECGHERCHTCHREPHKRSHSPPDPDLLQSVANRLAAYGNWPQSPGITASG